jgi:hypothetical protein
MGTDGCDADNRCFFTTMPTSLKTSKTLGQNVRFCARNFNSRILETNAEVPVTQQQGPVWNQLFSATSHIRNVYQFIQWTTYTSNKRHRMDVIGTFMPTGWLTSLNIQCSFIYLSTTGSSKRYDPFQGCNQDYLCIFAFPLIFSVPSVIL